ncbi:Pr6Pr family membrane protein [Streptococcus downei]|uniref:Membrane protein n=1 Tax=Streptococcus downei MFe28 TaxID=764290 RepID=A0A380JEI0_STRDO|nr:Pr6Pr family membrane protein [Streptococcus downei]SUN36547.1 membrane protein [Streptococcus downei MFe28]
MLVTYYRRILFILGILGLGLQLFKYGLGRLLYYTILSNLAVVVFLGVTLYWMAQKKEATLLSHKFLRFKGGLTVNDFDSLYRLPIVYHFFLAPLVTAQAYWNLENFLVHYILPLGFLLDSLLFDPRKNYRIWDPIAWLLFQLAYSFLALFNGFVTKWAIPGAVDSPFPYYFVNVYKYGWGFVLKNCLGLFVFYLILGYLFCLANYGLDLASKSRS